MTDTTGTITHRRRLLLPLIRKFYREAELPRWREITEADAQAELENIQRKSLLGTLDDFQTALASELERAGYDIPHMLPEEDSLREGTASEYNRVTCTPHSQKKIIPSGRTLTVDWTWCGRPLASKVEVYATKRSRKPKSVTYIVNTAFLQKDSHAQP